MNEFNQKFCDERHQNIKEEFEMVWKRMNGTEKKLWAIIVLLVGNIITLLGVLLKSFN